MASKVFLDTETSGLKLEEGHRIIEIGATIVEDGLHTGQEYHELINPERDIDVEATGIHGHTLASLSDKPTFSEVVSSFITFIEGKEVYIHNAPFDVGFLDQELANAGHSSRLSDLCTVHDTMDLAKQLHVRGQVNLDTLCSKYNVDKSERDKHGALLDAQLLSEVYLRMQESTNTLLLESDEEDQNFFPIQRITSKRTNIKVVKATPEDVALHEAYFSNKTSE